MFPPSPPPKKNAKTPSPPNHNRLPKTKSQFAPENRQLAPQKEAGKIQSSSIFHQGSGEKKVVGC